MSLSSNVADLQRKNVVMELECIDGNLPRIADFRSVVFGKVDARHLRERKTQEYS